MAAAWQFAVAIYDACAETYAAAARRAKVLGRSPPTPVTCSLLLHFFFFVL